MKKWHIPGEPAIWVFIVGDMLMFSIFFCQFVFDRAQQLQLFKQSQVELNVNFGAINTILLLTGSLFVALGVQAVQKKIALNYRKLFIAGWICGFGFLINKLFEYHGKLSRGISPETNDFFMYFYMYTGIHALHLIIGMCFLYRMIKLSSRNQLTSKDIRFIEIGASYWHLVDLLWVALFAILYLLT